MTRSFSKISAIGILVALIASGFVGLNSNVKASAPDSFVYANLGEPDYLDPAVDWETNGMSVIENVYETLLWYDGSRADSFVPVLATEVPTIGNGLVSADGLSYTIHVRPGVVFHDGITPLTADDVVYSFQRVLRIHDYSGPSWMLEQVLTDYVSYYIGMPVSDFLASSYQAPWIVAVLDPLGPDHIITEDDIQAVSESSIVKVDDMTVMFRLTHRYTGFVSILATTVSSIVCKSYVEANGGIENGWYSEFMNQNMFGTGPYKFVSWEIGNQIHLTRNDAYWGTAPALKDVYIVKVNDVNTSIMMLQSGDADSAYIPIDREWVFAGDPNIMITKGLPTFTMDFAGFNTNIDTTQAAIFGSNIPAAFFQDKNVRKAFLHLMDYQRLIDENQRGNAIQPNGPIPAGMLGYDASAPVYAYDKTMAAEYLQAAINPATGNSWWVDGFTIAFIYNAGNLQREYICHFLNMALMSLNSMPGTHGVFQATINAMDWPTYLTLMRSSPSPLPMFFLGWAPDYADPDDYVSVFLQSGQTYASRIGYSNAEIDALIPLAAGEPDPAIRQDLYQQITALCYEDAPYMWLMQRLSFQVMRSWVTGYYYNPMHDGLYYASLAKSTPAGIEITKMKAKAGVDTWTFEPTSDGMWYAEIGNNGLSKLTISISDLTTGMKVAKQQVSFAEAGPTGSVTTMQVAMEAGHVYQITATPFGKVGTSATLVQYLAG